MGRVIVSGAGGAMTEIVLTDDDRRAIDLFDSIWRLRSYFHDLAARGERDGCRMLLRAMNERFDELRKLKPSHKNIARNIAGFVASYDEGARLVVLDVLAEN